MRERGRKVLALIPLNLDEYLLSGEWQSGKCSQVLQRLAADFRGWDHDKSRFDQPLERVVLALRSDDSGREPPPIQRL